VGGRRGTDGSAGPATHRRANRGARRASNRKRYHTTDCRADAGTRRRALQGASAAVCVPTSVGIVIAAIIGRVGEPDENVSQGIKSHYDTVVTLVLAPQANKNLLCRDTIPHPI